MNQYTVVLMRHHRFSEIPGFNDDPDTDCYVALVEADDHVAAVVAARDQAFAADCLNIGHGNAKRGEEFLHSFELYDNDYTFLVLFDGHQDPKLHGFQTGPWQR